MGIHVVSEIESRPYPPLEYLRARLNAEFLNMLLDHKPSGRYMLTSEGSKYFLVYLQGSLRIAGVEGLRITRHERKIINRHRNCVRLRFSFARDKENTQDNERKGTQLRHQKRIACPVSGTVSGELPLKSRINFPTPGGGAGNLPITPFSGNSM
jgi:hypothetical protein